MKRIEMDYSKRCWEEQEKVHNRWHPDIPASAGGRAGRRGIPADSGRAGWADNPGVDIGRCAGN